VRVVSAPIVIAYPAASQIGDGELVARVRGGDAWAAEALYRRHVVVVASIARRLLRADADVDDVVQDTFLMAFARLDQLAAPEAFRGWLARIALSRVHRKFRWHRLTRWLGAEPCDTALVDQASSEASPAERAELALIDRALRRMPLKLRAPWVLRHVLGYGLEDAATACACSLATVKRRLADAEAAVADHIAGEAR
jgi:RNA polymerase sigma-70 factor, ECF subfamily